MIQDLRKEFRDTNFSFLLGGSIGIGIHPESWDKVPGVSAKPIVIEDDVWISFGATILQGVRIGSGSVISAGSVVTSDVPSGMVYQNKIQPYIKPLE